MFGALTGLGEIAVSAILQWVGTSMSELTVHGIVAGLAGIVGFLGTFAAVGIIEKMIAGAFLHGKPFEVANKSIRRFHKIMTIRFRLR